MAKGAPGIVPAGAVLSLPAGAKVHLLDQECGDYVYVCTADGAMGAVCLFSKPAGKETSS